MTADKRLVDTGAFIAVTDKSDQIEMLTINEEIKKKAWEIIKKYHDQAFSYTDCTSFAVMQIKKMKKLKRAFTFKGFYFYSTFSSSGNVDSAI